MLAPSNHCSAVIVGSQVTAVGGNRSSWNRSACRTHTRSHGVREGHRNGRLPGDGRGREQVVLEQIRLQSTHQVTHGVREGTEMVGSQVTAVGGNRSSWNRSACRTHTRSHTVSERGTEMVGSQVTAVGGNRSSWNRSACRTHTRSHTVSERGTGMVGSRVTAVGGNRSSWNRSACRT